MSEPKTIFENKDFVVVDKPAGLMVHAARVSGRRRGKKGSADELRAVEPTLVDWLLVRYPEIKNVGDDPSVRPGIVHRLDKATSGVMIVARTPASFERLKKLFQEHRMAKTYFAVVEGAPKGKKGTIDAPIGIKSGSLKRSIHSSKMAKPAVTEYSVVKELSGGGNDAARRTLLMVSPKTGRTHQIRVHLASIGHPIVGDVLYGKKTGAPRLMLHASALAFSDGAGNRFEFEAPLPEDFAIRP
ncbi:MAG TPA: RluA family pseudouridine synthase [Candidatus Paceibacterota bacterium]|nr:RluA family pseudouridine synthase [Candidatus Paceibacterota bacterium]